MAVPLDELASELENDPEGLGYADLPDAGAADVINDPEAVSDTLRRSSVPMGEVYAAVQWSTGWGNLGGSDHEMFGEITSTPNLDGSSTGIRSALQELFGTTSTTWTNISDTVERQASRAEVKWGEGTVVSHLEVAEARSL